VRCISRQQYISQWIFALPLALAPGILRWLLCAAFEKHEKQTHEHVSRLEKVFAETDQAAREKKCAAILGIIEEGQEIMKEFKFPTPKS